MDQTNETLERKYVAPETETITVGKYMMQATSDIGQGDEY